MLQTVSKDNKEVTKEFFITLIKELVGRYRSIPKEIDNTIECIINERSKQKADMTPDQKADEAFDAYLGTLELTEKQWRKQRYEQAADAARFDLLLNAVAEKEALSVSPAEVKSILLEIADQCNMEVDEVIAEVDPLPIREQLLRDKARYFILDHSVTEA